MVRFSTTLCSSEAPPSSKRLKTQVEDGDFSHQERPVACSSRCNRVGSRDDEGLSTPTFFDLDILDCNVCMEVLSPPIFQCCNGHYACQDCTKKMGMKCPSCTDPVGKIRNLALEKILESLRVQCTFYNQGCPTGMLRYKEKKQHEQRCLFAPRDCPLSDCSFMGPLNTFSIHFEHCHSVRTQSFSFDQWFTVAVSLTDKYVLLQEEANSIFFLLQAHQENVGKLLFVSSVLPLGCEEPHMYKLEVVKTGQRHLTLASTAQSFGHGKMNLNLIDFLLVPQSFLEKDRFQIELSIKQSIEFVEA